MSGSSESTQTSTPVYHTLPGATGDTTYGTSSGLFNQANTLTNKGAGTTPMGTFDEFAGANGGVTQPGDFSSYGDIFQPRNVDEGFFSKTLMDMLKNPTYGADNPNETALINSLMDTTAGRGAVSGLGAPTQHALMSSIAPTLIDLRNKELEQYQQGRTGDISLYGTDVSRYGTDVQRNLGLRGQDVGMREQDMQKILGIMNIAAQGNEQKIKEWMAALQSLSALAELAMPQEVVSDTTKSEGESQSAVEDLFEGLNMTKW